MKRVCVLGPITTHGEYHHNLQMAAKVAHELHKRGFAVYCPHLESSISVTIEQIPEKHWRMNALKWIEVADMAVFLPGWHYSVGAKKEHEFVDSMMMPKVYLGEGCTYENVGERLDNLLELIK